MKNQIGHKLGIMKRLLLSFAGLLVFCIPLALGIINAPESQARSFDNDKKDNESSIVLAEREVPVKITSDSGSQDVEHKTGDASKYISRGISSLKKGQLEDAVSEFSSAINIDPGKALTYVARGSAYFRLGRLYEAFADYNRAIEIKPALAVAYQNRGSVYYRQGWLDKALSDYNKTIELNPDLAAAYRDRGTIYQSQGEFDKAISDYSKALKLNPEDAVIRNLMGNAYQNRGSAYSIKEDYNKAISDYGKAIEYNPKNALNYSSRGNAYFMLNQLNNAVSDYNKAIELDPEMGKINGPQRIECRRMVPIGPVASTFKKKICLTKSQWSLKEKGFSSDYKILKYYEFLDTITH